MNDFWFASIMLEKINRALKYHEASQRSLRHLLSFSLHVLHDLRKEEEYNPENPVLQNIIESIDEIDETNNDFMRNTITHFLTLKWELMQLIDSSNTQTKIEKEVKFKLVCPPNSETTNE